MAAFARCAGILIAVAGLHAASAQTAVLRSAHRKLDSIENDRAPAGSAVRLTSAELTAYAREQAEEIAPGAVDSAVLTLTPGHSEAKANINFLRLRGEDGDRSGWLLQKLLDGERAIRIRVHIQSARGRARVDVELVEISGVAIEGRALDFLLSQFVIPSFPDARVGEWFELGHNIDRFEMETGAVTVWISKPARARPANRN